MVSSWCQSYDLCPVCCENVVRKGRTYCSDECLNDAKRYRRRMDNIVKIFRDTGFNVRFVNGVQLYMTMPLAIRDWYPTADWSFAFPSFFANVAMYRENDLTIALRRWLGDNIFELSVITGSVEHGQALTVEKSVALTPIGRVDVPIETFLCSKCKRTLVRSEESYYEPDDCCSDCSINSIPF